jgi:hypothetical protein
MNARKQMPPGRVLRKTLLIVGEGDAEEAFLKHLKALFVGRTGGIEVKVGNARGKGARNVINHARKQWASIAYDQVAVLFDTDTDWSPEGEARKRCRHRCAGVAHPALKPNSSFLRENPGGTHRRQNGAFTRRSTPMPRPALYPDAFPLALLKEHMAARPGGLVSRPIRLMTHTA